MSARVFFDTNILVYSVGQADGKSEKAEALLGLGGYVSVQVLNEFAAVASRKLGMSWSEVSEALAAIRTLCHPPLALRVSTHESALQIAARYNYSIYDSLILASAIEAKCTTLYPEDLHPGQVLENLLTIRNLFVA